MSDSTTVTVADTELPAQDVLDAAEQYLSGNDIVHVNDVTLADDGWDDAEVSVFYNDAIVTGSSYPSAEDLRDRANDALTDDFEQIPNGVGADLYYDGDNTVRLGDGTTATADAVADAVKTVSNPIRDVDTKRLAGGITVKASGWAPWCHSPSVTISGDTLTQSIGAAEVVSALE